MFKNMFSPLKISVLFSVFFITMNACKDKNNTEESIAVEEKVEEITSEKTDVSVEENAENLVELKDQSKLNPAQLQIQKLLENCVKNNYAAAAKLIMYRGKDESRKGQDAFNNDNPQEANTVKVTCDVIKNWLGESENYEFISYQEIESEFGPQQVVEVMFKKEKLGVSRHFFYLMDTPKGMLLVNMK